MSLFILLNSTETLSFIVFETYPAPVYLEPPSLCLVISFLFRIGVIKRGQGGDGASGGGLVADVLIDGW